MALPDTINFLPGTALVWADTTDYSAVTGGFARTAQIDLTGLGAGAARQGVKVDLGAAFARQFVVAVAIEMDVAATSGEVIEFWWAESPSATAGNANPGGTSGADAAYTGTAGDSLADSILQLRPLGSLIATADIATTVQYQTIGMLVAPLRYGMPVVLNSTGQAFEGDAVTMYVALVPYTDQIVD